MLLPECRNADMVLRLRQHAWGAKRHHAGAVTSLHAHFHQHPLARFGCRELQVRMPIEPTASRREKFLSSARRAGDSASSWTCGRQVRPSVMTKRTAPQVFEARIGCACVRPAAHPIRSTMAVSAMSRKERAMTQLLRLAASHTPHHSTACALDLVIPCYSLPPLLIFICLSRCHSFV